MQPGAREKVEIQQLGKLLIAFSPKPQFAECLR